MDEPYWKGGRKETSASRRSLWNATARGTTKLPLITWNRIGIPEDVL
ncbi:MAG: hypothetical protein HFI70_07495 [Lachnospiraceae bacterium]|nr:hypothetical protein [Lachnospiraceae bacterium]